MSEQPSNLWQFLPRYAILFVLYLLFLEIIFYLIGLSLPQYLIIVYALILTALQPLRDYLFHRRLQQEEEKEASSEPDREVDEDEFRSIMSPREGRKPYVTFVIIAVNIIVFLIMTFDGGSTNTEVLARYGAKVSPLILEGGEYWRLVSANFIHVGSLHLLMNMLVLYLFGSSVEKLYGPWKYWFIYMASGILGILASTLILPFPGAGASGAIFGIIGAMVVFGFRYQESIPLKYRDFYSWILLTFVLLDFGFSLIVEVFDTYAHLGGFLAGATITYLFSLRNELTGTFDQSPEIRDSIPRSALQLMGIVFLGLTAFSFFQSFQNVRQPRPYYQDVELEMYRDDYMGYKIPIPASWKASLEKEQIPGFSVWHSSLGQQLSVRVEVARSVNPQREFEAFLRTLRHEKAELDFSPLPEFSLPNSEIPHVSYHIYRSSDMLTTSLVTVAISRGNTYFVTLKGLQPKRLRPLYKRILKGVDFFEPAPFEKLFSHYEKLVEKYPENAFLLNAIAWRLAGEDKKLGKGIQFAKKAVELSEGKGGRPNSDVLDTLAELYFRQGRYSQAIQVGKRAAELAPNRPYFKYQLERFREARRLSRE